MYGVFHVFQIWGSNTVGWWLLCRWC